MRFDIEYDDFSRLTIDKSNQFGDFLECCWQVDRAVEVHDNKQSQCADCARPP